MEGDDPVSRHHHHHHHHHPVTMVTSTNNPSQPEGEAAPPSGKVEVNPGAPPPQHHHTSSDPCWDGCSGAGMNKGGRLPPLVETHAPQTQHAATESPGGGVSVKVTSTLLQPICLGDSPMVLPIHLQMSSSGGGGVAGAVGHQMGALHGHQMGATPYFMTSHQGALSLPLVLDPQLLQHLSSQMASGCPALPLQNNVLCQNASLTFGLPPPPPPPPLDQKSSGGSSSPDSNLLSLLQNPAFAAILQDLFTSQAACQSPGSAPGATDPFAFFTSPPPPPPPHPYASPLAPLVPPATLLVPYPVVIPLPVPLPIPLPIPVPVGGHHHGEDSKGNVPRSVCTVSRSTQTTCPRDATSSSSSSHTFSNRFGVAPPHPPHAAPPPSSSEVEALDLSVRLCPAAVQPKLESPPSPPQQDNVLDLSVTGSAKKKYIQPPTGAGTGTGTGRELGRGELSPGGGGAPPPAPSLGVPTLDSKLLMSGMASLEFARQHKWLQADASGGGALSREAAVAGAGGGSLGGGGPPGGNLETVSAASSSSSQKVIVSVKDAVPAFLCSGKIKGLSGVSTKNFSIKRDGVGGTGTGTGAASGPGQQLYGPLPPSASSSSGPPAGEQHDPGDPLGRKAPKNRAIKVKKVGSSQEILFLPIKKQRLAAFLPNRK